MINHNNAQKTATFLVHEEDCEMEGWDDPALGKVHWWTLLSADRTPSQAITCGVAEIASGQEEGLITHKHLQAEVYHILSGEGVVIVDGKVYPVRTGSTLFIPGNTEHGTRNTGEEPLRLFYVFAVDSFAEVQYEFTGMVPKNPSALP